MSDLRMVREGWLAVNREETQMLRSLTIIESINQWLMLQRAFGGQLQQTAHLFETQRREAMIELQVRLRSLVNLQGGYD